MSAMSARRRARLVAGVAAAVLLSGCTAEGSDLAQQYADGDGKSYVAGDGSVVQLPPSERGEPVEFTASTTEQEQVAVQDWRGEVVVLNVWYAACPPCRAEAPDLQAVAQDKAADGVRFLGVNIRDDAATAQAFERTFGVSYPSVLDGDGAVRLALRGQVSPTAVPTTLVLDREGRVAARVVGVVEASLLSGLVDDVLAEQIQALSVGATTGRT